MKRIFVSGVFNILHPGHLRLLRFAKECGDHLIVGVLSDELAGSAAHMSEVFRLEGVQTNLWVNEAFIINDPIEKIIEILKPDVVVKGKEHELGHNPELAILDRYGGQLFFSSGEAAFSSLDLLRGEFQEFNSSSICMPRDYLSRHKISVARLETLLNSFSRLKVCVVGDLIVDEYITCEALGMSQEDPTIVVTPIDEVKFIGGAGVVAAHAAGLGADVTYFSVTGSDEAREFADYTLNGLNVKHTFLIDQSRPTTVKQRYRSKGKTLLRVNRLHQGAISIDLQERLLEKLKKTLDHSDLLVFSDFNYGCLPQSFVDKVIKMAKLRKMLIVADSQSSSQIGDIGRFRGMDLITPTEREARISMKNHEDGLVVLAKQLCESAEARNVILKLGEEGLLVQTSKTSTDTWATDRMKALNSAPKDVAGAGDSLLITSAMTLACGGSIWEASLMGSIAAAVQVGRLGNTPLFAQDFIQEIRDIRF
jgi:rfaE bifunctional protein kinase chain/domain